MSQKSPEVGTKGRRASEWHRRTDSAITYGAFLERRIGEIIKEFAGEKTVPLERLQDLYKERVPSATVPGVEIVYPDLNVKYRVTTDSSGASEEIASVEIVPHNPSSPIDPRAFRLPVKTLVREARGHLALAEIEREKGRLLLRSKPKAKPSAELLSELVSRGVAREEIADRLGYSVGRIQQFIAEYRVSRDDLEWGVPRGPRPGWRSTKEGSRE